MARLPTDRYTTPWGDAEPCPCGRGSAFRLCCKGLGPLPYVKIPSLVPPGPVTGFSHPKCYMAATNNCSEGKSREHYISKAILDRIEIRNVSGMPWQEVGESQTFPASALVANVLCGRHNSALSPIDDLGVLAFDALTLACDYALNRRGPGRAGRFLMSGEGLELWMFKLAAGIHFGRIAKAEGGIVRDNSEFPLAELIDALSTGSLPPTSGLWFNQQPGIVLRYQIGVGPLLDVETNKHLGVQAQFGPLQFMALLITPDATEKQISKHAHLKRPSIIDFIGPERDARVILSWPGAAPGRIRRIGVTLSRD